MSIASMTGFARDSGQDGTLTWVWEAKSVNGRGLDVRCRLGPGMDALEPEVRRAVGERFKRGNVAVSLQTTRTQGETRLRVNRAALDQLVEIVRDLGSKIESLPLSIEGLLGVRGVVELAEEEESSEQRDSLEATLKASLHTMLDSLQTARGAEGARLSEMLNGHLDTISQLADKASECAELRPGSRRKRLGEQLAELLEAQPPVTEERLAQELALLAVKGDIREEFDRLCAHVAAARELMAEGGVVGRRLDFLCQEFNREANTLCSKALDVELTRIGLDLKAVIDQLREQVQNVE